MKILMIARETLYTSPGGDTVQIVSTAKYLRLLGLTVDIKLTTESIDYKEYQLIHFFNVIRPDDILCHIEKTNLPFVVSTIFVDYSEYEKKNRKGLLKLLAKVFNGDQIEYLKTVARLIKNGNRVNSFRYLISGHSASVKYVAKKAKFLLPNSVSEYRRFVKKYKFAIPYFKVTNAIDVNIFKANITPLESFRDHVICVGRIEGRKNQLNLIKALKDTNLRLTIIGKPSPNHISYFRECKKIVDSCSNMQIIEHIEQKELPAIYAAAKVHVLPSWFETTGLSTLEAAAMGCNIVVTRKGDTEEYFSDFAYYCDPENIKSIKETVIEAYNAPKNPNIKTHIFQNFNWEIAAKETLLAYKAALEKWDLNDIK